MLELKRSTGAPLRIGAGGLVLIAGPCVLESRDGALTIAEQVARAAAQVGVDVVFKASFDKANRTSIQSFRGPGLDVGLRWLEEIRDATGLCVTTDIHEPHQAGPVAEVVDLVQIPAFLSRQTDMLVAAARTGRPVNVKKGPFLSAADMRHAVDKIRQTSPSTGIMLTERGTTFGYNDVVVDMRSLVLLRAHGAAVCFDCTHTVQRPGGGQGRSSGDRSLAPALARAAVAVGVDALFMEVHDDPDTALSDGPNMIPTAQLPSLWGVLRAIHEQVR